MTKIKIEEMNFPDDKLAINDWHKTFQHTKAYETIESYVLENYLMDDLASVIEINHEILDTDYREEKKAFVIKNKKSEIVGFILCDAYDIADYASMLYLQYIVFKPDFQHKGYGTEVFNEFFSNIKKYIGFEPTDVYAIIHRHNKSSISLFEKFGFDFSRRPQSRFYLRADNDFYTIKNILNQKSYE